MVVRIFIEPGKRYTWDEFRRKKPRCSIALDGIVEDVTKRDKYGPYANFDHHTGSDDVATHATCGQVYIELRLGRLQKIFRRKGVFTVNCYIDNPDEDACLSTMQFVKPELVVGGNLLFRKLVEDEDKLDATRGAYPLRDSEMYKKMAWIFAPYNDANFNRRLGKMSAKEQKKEILRPVHERILAYASGNGEELPVEGQYEVMGRGEHFTLVRETGPAARLAMHRDRIDAYLAFREKSPEGRFKYALGCGLWEEIKLSQIYERLNRREGDNITNEHHWGGSNNRGGSPKKIGSIFSPQQLLEIIEEELASIQKDCPG